MIKKKLIVTHCVDGKGNEEIFIGNVSVKKLVKQGYKVESAEEIVIQMSEEDFYNYGQIEGGDNFGALGD